MSDLVSNLNHFEADLARAHAAYGDGGLAVGVFSLDDAPTPNGPLRLEGLRLPPDCFPYTTWRRSLGVVLLGDQNGDQHQLLYVLAGTDASRRGPLDAFSALSRRAGALLFRLQPGLGATGVGNAPELDWMNTLYSYLKGTQYVVEGAGYSRISSVFASSTVVLSLLRRAHAGQPVSCDVGSLRPGIPGEPSEFRVERVRRLTEEEYHPAPLPPAPQQARGWLAELYRSVPVADRGSGPSGEPVVFEPVEALENYLRGIGQPEEGAVEACAAAGWITFARLTVGAGLVPGTGRLNLPQGEHILIVILPAVLDGPEPTATQPAPPAAVPPAPPREDGPFEPFSFRWGDVEGEFLKDERRYYRLLLVVWSTFRVRAALHFKEANDRLAAADSSKLELRTMKNYARDLSQILTERFKFPARLELDGYYLRWRDLPDVAASP